MSTSSQQQVSVTERALVVSTWQTSDLAVLTAAKHAVERGEDLQDWLTRVVAIGAAAVSTAGTTTDLARIDAALHRLDGQVHTSLETALARLDATVVKATDPETGDVAKAAQSAVDRLAAGVQRVLTGSEALLPEATNRAVTAVTDRALSEIQRLLEQDRNALAVMVTADRERTAVEVVKAVSAHNAEFAAVVSELRQLLTARATQTARESSGPRKGLSYENDVHAVLQEIAAAGGDGGATFTGGTAGVDGSRKGDTVVHLRSLPGSPRRLVAEAKNRPGRSFTAAEWAAELDHAMRSREADVAIGVCPADQMPGTSRVFVIDSRRLVVAWDDGELDLLGPAYLLMRMAAGQHGAAAGPGQAEIEANLRAITASLAPLDEIQRHAGTCRRAAEKVATTATKLRDDMAARIEASSRPTDGEGQAA